MPTLDLRLGGERVRISAKTPPGDITRSEIGSFRVAVADAPALAIDVEVSDQLPRAQGPVTLAFAGNWEARRSPAGTRFDVMSPERRGLRAIVECDAAVSTAHVRVRGGASQPHWSLMEVLDPVVKLLLVERLARSGRALLVHALGVRWNSGDGALFVGPSGAGKSTLARLLRNRGVTILCDECVAVRRDAQGWLIEGTPFHGEVYEVERGPARLARAFLIRHAASHVGGDLERADPARHLVPQLFLPFWNEEALGKAMAAAGLLLAEVSTQHLGFAPLESIHAFLACRIRGADAHAV